MKSIFDSKERRMIIQLLFNKPQSIKDIEVNLQMNRGSVRHHLKVLESFKIIKNIQDSNRRGNNRLITLDNKNTIMPILKSIKEDLSEELKKYNKLLK